MRRGPQFECSEQYVLPSGLEFSSRVAHRRAAIAAAPRLVEHEWPVQRPKPIDEVERFWSESQPAFELALDLGARCDRFGIKWAARAGISLAEASLVGAELARINFLRGCGRGVGHSNLRF